MSDRQVKHPREFMLATFGAVRRLMRVHGKSLTLHRSTTLELTLVAPLGGGAVLAAASRSGAMSDAHHCRNW
jgi:hypothetical protein